MELIGSTKILMADGSNKPINEICIGDRVRSPYFTYNSVVNVFLGMEEVLVYIVADGRELCMSKNSLIETANGVIPVTELQLYDSINIFDSKTADTKFVNITEIGERTEAPKIYSLELDREHTYIANGFCVGDFQWMDSEKMNLYRSTKEDSTSHPTIEEELRNLLDQLKKRE